MPTPSLKKKIAGLFMIGFRGSHVDDRHHIAEDIRKGGLGGVILFDKMLSGSPEDSNITTPEQVSLLTARLYDFSDGELLIAVDQEGGKVSRFKTERGFPVSAEAAHQGKQNDTTQTAGWAKQTAEMLKQAGINWNLAPVVDLALEPDNPIISRYGRSFGPTPATVTEHSKIWVEEHRRLSIRTCLKHFPGHGSARSDSHLGFVDISECWQESELEPYQELIEQGFADAVMVGHLFNSRIDHAYPATLSRAAVGGLLRDRLSFHGLVVSDDMQMRAITDHYGLAEGCCLALAAGVDLLIVGNNLSYDPCLLQTLVNGVEDGMRRSLVTPSRLEAAWANVQEFKKKGRKVT